MGAIIKVTILVFDFGDKLSSIATTFARNVFCFIDGNLW